MKTIPYFLLLITVSFFSCHKESASPATPPAPPPGPTNSSMNINLTYPGSVPAGILEVIISEPGGKILLDTLDQGAMPVKATLKTSDTLLDVSYIYAISTATNPVYSVWVYKGVNPSGILSLIPQQKGFVHPSSGPISADTLFCMHFPDSALKNGDLNSSFMFTNGLYGSIGNSLYNSLAKTLSLDYIGAIGANNYFVLPQLGLYKLFEQQGTNDTLDLSVMDTASSITFDRPYPYNINYQQCMFNGVPDTTDLSKTVSLLYLFDPIAPAKCDLLFPKTPMQKYEVSITALNNTGDALSYYGYVNTIPTQLPFPDANSFSVTSKQNDNFSVQFTNPSSSTYCTTYFAGTRAQVNFYTSPDSTTIHPISFLSGLQSKLLNGVSLTDLTPKAFQFNNVPGCDYGEYFRVVYNPQPHPHQIYTWSGYSRSF